jgi:hypothetical protein
MVEILRDFSKIYESLDNIDPVNKSLSLLVYGAVLRESRIGKVMSGPEHVITNDILPRFTIYFKA